MKEAPHIDVGIICKARIIFRLSGKYLLAGTGEYCYNTIEASIENGNIRISTGKSRRVLGKEVTFTPCNLSADHFELSEVVIGIQFHWEQKENQKFQGALKLLVTGEEIQVINIIPVENYISSVISSEMSGDSSLNLLKAHAIISRSWALNQMYKPFSGTIDDAQSPDPGESESEYIHWYGRMDHEYFDVCADDHCQRYQGITRSQNPNVIRAVNETNGQVLSYEDEICDARYSKCCGGVSELFENCWEPVSHPYLRKVIDKPETEPGETTDLTLEMNAVPFINGNSEAFCNTRDRSVINQVLNEYDRTTEDFFRWEVKYTQDEISELIHEKSGIDFGKILDLVPVQRGESGRLLKLQIVGTKKSLCIGKELVIRRWLSKTHLYSSAITIEKLGLEKDVPGGFHIHGAGWGHGVGLCQIGAAVMGEKGYPVKEILNHYYPGASIETKYN